MRALWLTSMWPDKQRPWYGSFIHSQAQSLRALSVEIEVLYMPGYRTRSEYVRGAVALRKALGQRFDLVHAHYGYSAVVGSLQRRAPLVVSYCGSDLLGTATGRGSITKPSRLLATGFAQVARTASATITKSEEMERVLPRKCRIRNHVIPNGVDLHRFNPIDTHEARKRLGWPSGRPIVLFVGDPGLPSKNFELAKEVFAELERRGRLVDLRVARDVEPSAIPIWMSAADALLFTSLSEGSPNVIKEAMAMELPIVSAPVGDVPERLRGISGTFVVERTVRTMADALVEAIQVGRTPAAREAIRHLSLERVADRVLRVYRQVAVR
jgi:glycosyltransferase involved in cell wall biosynthesis